MAKKGIVDIHGKEYKTVIMRVNEFRERFTPADGWAIRTWLVSDQDDRVIIQASICDKDDHVVATGFAEEVRGSSKINKTSALENCETSAIGRALAAFGLGGEEYCSADELVNALAQQESRPEPKPAPPKKEKEEPKKKPDAVERIKKYLDKTSELVGYDEAEKSWVTLLRRNPEDSKGNLSLGDMIKDKNVTFTNLWNISKRAKEMYEATVNVVEAENNQEPEKEDE